MKNFYNLFYDSDYPNANNDADIDIDFELNENPVYCVDDKIFVRFSLPSFQPANDKTGLTELKELEFNFIFSTDPRQSGAIDEVFIKLIGYDDATKIVTLDEIEPESLYWVGRAFMKMAKHFGIDKKELLKRYKVKPKEKL